MKNYLLIFFLCFIFNKAHSIETKIIHNIQNEIITNIDIKNEFRYLVSLNSNLKNALFALAVPFARYNDLIFLINFLVSTEECVFFGIVLRNSSFI